MTAEVQAACRESGQKVPEGIYQVAAVIYNSLAQCYADTVREIEKIEHVTYPCINIVGGGANAAYLNELTAKATGKTVYAGPTEATAIGNHHGADDRSRRTAGLGRSKKMCIPFI